MTSMYDSLYSKNTPQRPSPLITWSTCRSPYCRIHSPCSCTTKTQRLRYIANYNNTKPTNIFHRIPFSHTLLWGLIITSSFCLCQTDLKSPIAYSSISHIALVIVVILIQTPWSYIGATALIIAHCLTPSILFCLANSNYKRIYSRTIIVARGLQTFLPLIPTWWLLASLTNLALPPNYQSNWRTLCSSNILFMIKYHHYPHRN